jgi:hypothetical protein
LFAYESQLNIWIQRSNFASSVLLLKYFESIFFREIVRFPHRWPMNNEKWKWFLGSKKYRILLKIQCCFQKISWSTNGTIDIYPLIRFRNTFTYFRCTEIRLFPFEISGVARGWQLNHCPRIFMGRVQLPNAEKSCYLCVFQDSSNIWKLKNTFVK